MDYCAPRGIPHSAFLGWDRGDRDAALWWLTHDRERCRHCGTSPRDWADDEFAFVADHQHCRGCEVTAGAQEKFEKERSQYRRGTSIVLTARAVMEARHALSGHSDGDESAAEVQGPRPAPP